MGNVMNMFGGDSGGGQVQQSKATDNEQYKNAFWNPNSFGDQAVQSGMANSSMPTTAQALNLSLLGGQSQTGSDPRKYGSFMADLEAQYPWLKSNPYGANAFNFLNPQGQYQSRGFMNLPGVIGNSSGGIMGTIGRFYGGGGGR